MLLWIRGSTTYKCSSPNYLVLFIAVGFEKFFPNKKESSGVNKSVEGEKNVMLVEILLAELFSELL